MRGTTIEYLTYKESGFLFLENKKRRLVKTPLFYSMQNLIFFKQPEFQGYSGSIRLGINSQTVN
jgi:hypothetical protein